MELCRMMVSSGVEKKTRTKVTHPVDKVVDIVDKPVEVVEDDDEDHSI
jgi:hypothetical protein